MITIYFFVSICLFTCSMEEPLYVKIMKYSYEEKGKAIECNTRIPVKQELVDITHKMFT